VSARNALPFASVVAVLLLAARVLAESSETLPQSSETLPQVVTLEAALDVLRNRSPSVKASSARAAVAQSERVAARVYPNPSLTYGGIALLKGANTGAQWQHQIAVEQPVLLFGQRAVRERYANLQVRVSQARLKADVTDQSYTVRQAFITLLACQQRSQILEESHADLTRIEHIVRGRQIAGDRSIYDVTRLEAEVTTVFVELRNARTDVTDASAGLATLLGFPQWLPHASVELAPIDLPTYRRRLWQLAERQRPSIRVALAEHAAARGALALAQRERLPVPAFALGTMLTQQADSASLFFGCSLPLPIFDRGQGAIAKATAEITAQQSALRAERKTVYAEVERARAVLIQQRNTLRMIERQIPHRITDIRRMAEESYRGGGSSILEFLDALRTIKAMRLAHLDQQEAVKLAEARLIAIIGLDAQHGQANASQ